MNTSRTAILVSVATISAFLLAQQRRPAQAPKQPAKQASKKASTQKKAALPADGIQFTTLPGFRIERVVPPGKTDTYVVLTFDSLGRPVVSKEQDHPRTLFDNNGDGIFESEKVFTDKVRNCQGLWFEARTLWAMCSPAETQQGPGGGNRSGLFRMEDTNGDDVADTFEQINSFTGGIGEHGPHAIRRGPAGETMIMLGNHTAVPPDLVDSGSPLTNAKEAQLLERYSDPRGHAAGILAPGGYVARLNRDRKNYSIITGGFRNAYDFAFNLAGEIFTFDSDMEWDINMPWYRDVRTVHGIPGGDYGWRNGSGKLPPYMLDTLPATRDLGRGSPVGVEFYHHNVYPSEFYDALFEADWSRGRLLYTALTPSGATYKGRADRAEFVHGEPLNITDVEVGPDGMIWFTTGGRQTEGGVYRVRYAGRAPAVGKPQGILAVARQPQPLSSWGWAAVAKAKEAMGDAWAPELEKLARSATSSVRDRVQALFTLQRHGPEPSPALLADLLKDRSAAVRAAAIYIVGAQSNDSGMALLATGLKDLDPVVRRRSAEALVRRGLSAERPSPVPVSDIYALMNHPDRFVRYTGRLALERTPRTEWRDKVLKETNPLGAIEGMYALVRTDPTAADFEAIFEKQFSLMRKLDLSVEDKLRLLRAFQLAAMETRNGLRPEMRKQAHSLLIGQFPSRNERFNRELARTLAYCGQPEAIGKILAAMPAGEENPQLQIHYAYCLRELKEGWTKAQKDQFIAWFPKAAKWRGGASFTGYINLIFDSTIASFTPEEKQLAFKMVPQFAPLTEAELAAMASRGGRGGRGGGRPRLAALARPGTGPVLSKQEIFEELLFNPGRGRGAGPNLAAGRELFDKECASCHRFGSLGNDFGPDLTTIASRFSKKDILEALFWPSKTISDQYESTIIETREADIYNCLVIKEDAQKVVIKTAEVERPVEVLKSNIRSRRKSSVSIMPEGLADQYAGGFGRNAIADLVAFLQAPAPK